MEFYKILLEIMEEKSLKIPDVARLTGLSDSTIRSILTRKTKNIILEVAFKMSKGLDVSLERLNGESPLFFNNISSKEEVTLLKNYNNLNPTGKDKLIEYSNDLIETPKYIKTKNNVTELITATREKEEYTFAAHDDNLDEETAKRMKQKAEDIFKRMDEE